MIGDQNPPAYPVLNVHVPEPTRGALQRQWDAEDQAAKAEAISIVEQKLNAHRDFLGRDFGKLDAAVAEILDMVRK